MNVAQTLVSAAPRLDFRLDSSRRSSPVRWRSTSNNPPPAGPARFHGVVFDVRDNSFPFFLIPGPGWKMDFDGNCGAGEPVARPLASRSNC
jgi:hypothetical protein